MARRFAILALIGIAMSGCQKTPDTLASGAARGRYVGVGHYSPGAAWAQVVRSAANGDPAKAKPDDDDQVIIVMDSLTGELRQCGNFSGRCIGLKPWAKSLEASEAAPATLIRQTPATAQPDGR